MPVHEIRLHHHALCRQQLFRATLGLLLLLLAGWAQAAEQQAIRIGIYQNPPKIFFSDNGRPSGFFADIISAIAHKADWRVEFVSCQWEGCLQMLQQGEIDLLPDMAWSAERADLFDFNSEIVLYNWSTIYRQSGLPIHSIDDLDGRPLAVLRGSIQYQALKRMAMAKNFQPIYVEVDSPSQMLELATRREVDAVLLNRLYAQDQRQNIGLRPTHLIIEHSLLHFAATQGRHHELLQFIDQQLQAMKQDHQSVYYQALARWTEQADESWKAPRWMLWALEILLLLLVALLFAAWILRKMVRQRTAELEKRNTAVMQSEKMFHALFDHSADAILLFNGERFYGCNRAALGMFDYPDQATMAAIERDALFSPKQADGNNSSIMADQYIAKAMSEGPQHFEWLNRRANGEVFPSDVNLVPVETDSGKIIQITIRDISQRHARQQELDNLTRALHTLSQVNHALIHARSEPLLLEDICRIIVSHGGYRLAWIGYAEYDDERSIRPMAQAGFEADYLDSLEMHWQDDRHGQLPASQAIRSGRDVVIKDIPQQVHYAALHQEAMHYGYRSCIALPLQREGTLFGVLNIYSERNQIFSDDEVLLLRQMADDLAYGIQTQRLHADHADIAVERAEYRQQLQQAMLQTIQAFSVMLELRDPYTAGHQRRSSDLAVAIAKEMGLDEQRIEGIRFGAMLHDIGNIQVPAEILIRPGSLTEPEMSLLRNHAVAGYEILRDIPFPWPVAKMILNHHERMDGSGYPEGRKGDQIPLEARIIAVADVVEAMLSHRPYRTAHNTADTLEELQQQRGKAFDERVVDACLRLFKQKGYRLPV